ncbi:hypothetical protein Htur_5036 (plasmid) [Haloterrigena turkmenica DSM 5511]|uniref:Uncharacterized protein n=1 Tax=Haloterrigena turkmenica (strain ATCC 51198 / DSM 5511 / JCM 9101 / NCIMB 13204 / VKM B-1734 / 4k) TaxID=543526 RepID=D2S3H7_HALTV|nr:hypothetical protein [Haloterrigena turkmenica]ADB63924.1 hypothetical protein Htur_5036 [Haloterrigena turkmenica DSM 5511]
MEMPDTPDNDPEETDSDGASGGVWAAICALPGRLWAVLASILATLLVGLRGVGRRVRGVWTTVRYRATQALVSFIMGSHPNTSRLLATAVVGSGVAAGVGIMAVAVNQAETSASSGPIVRFALGLATSPWVWILAIVLLFRQVLFFGDRLLARVTASESGYSYKTIRRLAEEAKRPDLDRCERVLVQSGDSAERITEWCLDALSGNGHDAPTFNPPGADDDSSDETNLPRQRTAADEPIDVDPADDDDEPDFWTQLRLFRLELGSAIDLNGILWRFLVPAGLTFVGIMLWLRIWIQPWVLPVVVAAAAFVGGAYYWAVDLRHRRRLKALRAEETTTQWTDLAILTKTVEVPETTMYYGYLDGKVYASEDKRDLAETLADRALDRLEGRQPAPAIEEKNAYLLKRYLPMLEAWEQEYERKAIMDQLIDTVADAPEGLLPRDILIDEVVEYDRRYVAFGLLFIGRGRDPDLVREVYQDLVEIHALAETPVTVQDTETGGERELIAVSKGDDSFPPNVVQLRGEFSSLFGKQAFQTRYDAPEIDANTTPAPFIRPETRETAD